MISKDLLNTDSIDKRDLITEEGLNDKDKHSWHRVKQQLEQELVSANKYKCCCIKINILLM
ncbi:hypothetical protein A0H76_9 [Hepatospora eriocheir]|uniref:Uncharacterized protein n=1 Tax=Hepatospora eriocheir TaxID=1081669 RepID=A0A1X0QLP3_9MICR|nr:hypothetical protein A0H76_9 [Hepatospora eriocheir]